MVKPIKTAGKTQKQQIAMATNKKQRTKPGVAALKEIKKQQKSTRKCIPKKSFHNLVMNITANILAERSDPIGKRRTKNSQRNQSTTTTTTNKSSKSPMKSKTKSDVQIKKEIKKEVKKELKKEVKTEIKKDVKPKIKSEKL